MRGRSLGLTCLVSSYNESAAYIIQQLIDVVGDNFCEITTQGFVVPVYQELELPKLTLHSIANDSAFVPLTYQYGACPIPRREDGFKSERGENRC